MRENGFARLGRKVPPACLLMFSGMLMGARAHAEVVSDQVQPHFTSRAYFGPSASLAQTFTPAISGQLDHVILGGWLLQPATVTVVDVLDGKPGDTVLGRKVAPNLHEIQEVSFADRSVFLNAGTPYAIVVELDIPRPAGYDLVTSHLNHYPQGALWQKLPAGEWEAAYLFGEPCPDMDLVFATFMIPGIPPIRITAPAHNSSCRTGEQITMTAEAGPDVQPSFTVEFFAGSVALGTVPAPPYSIIWLPSQSGTFDLTAQLRNQSGTILGTSAPVQVTIRPPGPVNDDFASRIVLDGDYARKSFSTAQASLEPGETRPTATSAGKTVWWSWTAPRSGLVSVDVLEPDRATAALAVAQGGAVDTLITVTTGVGHCSFFAGAGGKYEICADELAGTLVAATLVLAQADVEIISPVPHQEFTAPISLLVLAARIGSSRNLMQVEVHLGSSLLKAFTAEPYETSATVSMPGYLELRAAAIDTDGVRAESTTIPIVVRPRNDDFENAVVVSGHSVAIQTSNRAATMQYTRINPWDPPSGEPHYADNQGGHSIWYKWTAPKGGLCTIGGQGANFGLLLGSYVGTSVAALSLVAVNALNGGGPITFSASAGTTYCISIDGGLGEEGELSWYLNLRPSNDDFARRAWLDGSVCQEITSFRGATLEAAESSLVPGPETAASLWWSWRAPVSGAVKVFAASISARSQIAAFTGTSLTSLVRMGGTESWTTSPTLHFDAVEGTTYQVALFGRANEEASLTFLLQPEGIRILNPLDASVFAAPANLQVRAQIDESESAVDRVDFLANDLWIGSVDQPPYYFSWNSIAAGTYKVVARCVSGGQLSSSSPPVTILVSSTSTPDPARLFAGTFANCSYVVNALGEMRLFGSAGSQFGLSIDDSLMYPQPASWPEGVKAWASISGGSQVNFWNVPYSKGPSSDYFASWALTDSGELYRSGTQRVPFPPGVTRWLQACAGSGNALAVGDDGQVYLNGQSSIQFAAQGVAWKHVAFGGGSVATLAQDGRAFEHGTGIQGEPVSVLIPFPSQVSQWIRLSASLNEIVLQGQNNELYQKFLLSGWPRRPLRNAAHTADSAAGLFRKRGLQAAKHLGLARSPEALAKLVPQKDFPRFVARESIVGKGGVGCG